MLKSLFETIAKAGAAIEQTRGRVCTNVLRRCLETRQALVVIGSGNSVYPATYFNWLLRKTAAIPCLQLSPLEFALSPPAYSHAVLLFSQSARRGDSVSVEKLCQERNVPLFLVCDEDALNKESVASRLEERGPGHVFATFTGKERAFLNIRGTTAASVSAYEIAAGLGFSLPAQMPDVDWPHTKTIAEECPFMENEFLYLLYGPAGRSAAEAFMGYHLESLPLRPPGSCDMKFFTHGVWRGLKETGTYTILFLEDRDTIPLADYLCERVCEDHRIARVKASPPTHWAAEPLELLGIMTYLWADICVRYAETHPNWYPIYADMSKFKNYHRINEAFDITCLTEGGEHSDG